MPFEAAASEPANACSAPGPIDVTTAGISPYCQESAVAACAIATSLHGYAIGSSLFGGLALLALLLASLGLYGVVAFSVSRRTREIGIRVALGADRGAVVRAVMREGLALVGMGAVLGLGLSMLGASALRSVLLGVGALDVISYGFAALALLAAATVACAIPARRAARIQPTVALRQT